MKYLSVGTNAKTAKSDKLGEYLTAILYLAPATLSGRNVCPWSTEGCRKACLNTAGRGAFSNVQEARIRKTDAYYENPSFFIAHLNADIHEHIKRCKAYKLKPAIRLNGTSDILWEKIAPQLFERYPDITFYDYTKAPHGFRKNLPTNYRLTYSAHENMSYGELKKITINGDNVAMVFHGSELPTEYMGIKVINGDAHDLCFLDPSGVIVGLLAKGKAKKDESGFVRNAA
jgi:hypothetical protein